MIYTEADGIAQITLSELHDWLAGTFEAGQEEGDVEGGPIWEFKLIRNPEHDHITESEYEEADKLVAELNDCVQRIKKLDSKFHDLFDCR